MLTSEHVKLRLKVLIFLAATTVALLITGGVVMYASSCYGFTAGTPIVCTTIGYFKTKYNMTNNIYLSVSFVGMILAFVSMAIALIFGIVELVSINKLENNQAEEQCRAIVQKTAIQMFIVTVLGMLGACIPLGYFLSFVFQTTSQCGMGLNLYWLIIACVAALAEALMITCVIILLVMQVQTEDEKVEEPKKQELKVPDDIKGAILNTENDQKVPLLQRQRLEEPKPEPVSNHQTEPIQRQQNTAPYQKPLQAQPQNNHQQIQMSRFVTQKIQAEPIQATYHNNIPQQQQIKPQRHVTQQDQTETISEFPPCNLPKTNKESKIELKPQSGQTVTHITVNFPNNYPQTPPSINTSSSKDSLRRKKSSFKQRRQVIKQSVEEQLSSDSDDHYYKRARKNKKKWFYDEQKDKQGGKRRRKEDVEVNYQREFDRIPSRFKVTPSQPKYVMLSPQSMRTFYDFVKNQHEHTQKKTRNFVMPQRQHPQPQLKLPKKNYSSREQKNRSPQINEQGNHLKPDRYVVSQVKQYHQTPTRMTDQGIKPQPKQQVKERSIYQKLDVGQDESDNSFKKYAPFFRSSHHILKREDTDHDKKSDYDEYFNLLNGSHAAKKDVQSPQQNYRSISNYSSVLNDGGKMPTEREHHSRMNVDQNRIRSNNSKAQKRNSGIIDQIRSKYA